MSVKHIRVCDRCGKEYVMEDHLWGLLSVGQFISYKNISGDMVVNEDEIDLCESCMKEFNHFMDMENKE